jgi:hypothetical protein
MKNVNERSRECDELEKTRQQAGKIKSIKINEDKIGRCR